ncbi:MAG TPA: amidohydrolase, partial [Thermoanaerobaculia bacterium]
MRTLLCTLLLAPTLFATSIDNMRFAETKSATIKTIDANEAEMVKLSDEIWRYAETALKETRSSKALADWAQAEGFRVTRGVGNLPTAFVAEFGSGKPVIGIMGEYDALPGISQKAQPVKEALEAGAPGHGCGHN